MLDLYTLYDTAEYCINCSMWYSTHIGLKNEDVSQKGNHICNTNHSTLAYVPTRLAVAWIFLAVHVSVQTDK